MILTHPVGEREHKPQMTKMRANTDKAAASEHLRSFASSAVKSDAGLNRRVQPGVYADLEELVALQHRARGFSFLPRQPIHSLLSGRHASRLRGRGLNFEEIRRYLPGDDIRQIDWKATLRTRRTQSRVYTEERERTVLLLVDQRITMFFGSVKNMKSVTAAEAAALAAWRVLAQKDRIGALIFNDTRISEIRPQRSRATAMRILHAVLEQNHALSHGAGIQANPAMFNEALRRCSRLAKHDCLVCIISDGCGHDEESRRLLTRIAQHNDVVFAFVYDPLETALPDAGPLVFGDGVRQLEVDTGNRKLRNRYQETFAEERAAGRRFLLQRETPVLPLSTSEGVVEQLRHQLGKGRDDKMTPDPTSLDRLHDIVAPPPVPWWPPAPGWYFVLGILAVAGIALTIRGIHRWQSNRYRREALAEWQRLQPLLVADDTRAEALASLAELLKRTALSAFPRRRVASLTGDGVARVSRSHRIDFRFQNTRRCDPRICRLRLTPGCRHIQGSDRRSRRARPAMARAPPCGGTRMKAADERRSSAAYILPAPIGAPLAVQHRRIPGHANPRLSLAPRAARPAIARALAGPASPRTAPGTDRSIPRPSRRAQRIGKPGEGAVIMRGGWLRFLSILVAWVCTVLALARPQIIEPPVSKTIPVRDMLLAVDLSGSMATQDFTDAHGRKVDRLTAVKEVLDDFLAKRKGDRVGLIFFGSAPFVQAPFTEDLAVCRQLLDEAQVKMAGPQTAFGDALGLAITVFDRSSVKERVLIALTDGNDTASRVPPAKAAEIARDKGVVVHTISVGDPRAAGEDALDVDTLKNVASITGGIYAHAADRGQLDEIYRKLDAIETQKAETITHRPRRDVYWWPLAVALVITALNTR